MSDSITSPDGPVGRDSDLTPSRTERPDGGEHLHSSDHSIAEEDIETSRRHQQETPTQP